MAISREVIAEIKYKNDIESVISPYVTLKRRGKNLVGLCPFHNEKTPSFTVYPENGSFYCFGCGVGGDCISFTSMIENLDYIESVKMLAEKSGIDIPEEGYDNSLQQLKTKILEINREAARFYHNVLMSENGKWALDYLIGRGLTMSTIRHFGLGCAPDNWDSLLKHLTAKGYTISEMLQADVIAKSQRGTYYDRFRNRVMFPIINLRGNVIAFSGRIRPGDTKAAGKYVNSSETLVYKKGENLYGFNFAKNFCSERVILVEGNMDVIALHQAGFENTVAALGTAFTLEQSKLLSRYAKEIVITLDSDAAGQKAVKRALDVLKDSGMPIRVLVLPDGKDPDEYIKKNSPEKFKALLDGAVNDIDYKLLMAAQGIDTSIESGKLEYLNKVAEILAATDDPMAVDLYESKIAEKYGIKKLALDSTVQRLKQLKSKKEFNKTVSQAITPRYSQTDINPDKRLYKRAAAAEESIISVLLQHPDFFNMAEEKLLPEKFITEINRRIYTMMYEVLSQGETVDLSQFGDRLNASEMGYAISLLNGVKAQTNAKAVLSDSIKVLLEEYTFKINNSQADENQEDWESQMQAIINKKKGE